MNRRFSSVFQSIDSISRVIFRHEPRYEGWRSQCEWYLLKLDQSLRHSWSESSPHQLAWRPQLVTSWRAAAKDGRRWLMIAMAFVEIIFIPSGKRAMKHGPFKDVYISCWMVICSIAMLVWWGATWSIKTVWKTKLWLRIFTQAEANPATKLAETCATLSWLKQGFINPLQHWNKMAPFPVIDGAPWGPYKWPL